ncbi:peroxisomal oxidase [Cytidiella melzeri]|nr:peroxisomal oxidase [Cytidiella melzeri]
MPRLPPNEQTHVDLVAAREQSRVDVGAIREYLYGSKERWNLHSEIVNIVSTDPVFAKARWPFMNRKERYKNVLRMIHRVHELQDAYKWSTAQFREAISLLDETHPYTLHLVAFEPVFMAQASPELRQKYGELIANAGIIGCYLQTELAHGSNLTSLETTATYLPDTKQFEIHSPTFTASKWWVGGAGKFATHGVVQAQLILPGGKNMGPHLFFVQLRSLDDHSVLPGIQLGDIGIKAMGAWSTTDNGYARFDHVKIPAEHMLSKFSRVTEEGKYVQPPHAKISYGGMMYIRSTMITNAGWTAGKAITIAIRYAHARRQGNISEDGLEKQIITYSSVHSRLLPILSRSYAFLLLGRNLERSFSAMSSRLATGDTSLLAEMHATTSGLKTLVSTATAQDLETARRCLGGHGFSEAAGIGRIYAAYLPNTTFEGDNFILDLQVLRAAVKAFNAYSSSITTARSRTPYSESAVSSLLSPFTRFLRHLSDSSPLQPNDWYEPHVVVELLERRALCAVREYVRHSNDPDAGAAQRVAKAVTEAFVAAQVESLIQDVPSQLTGREEARVVVDLLVLFLLTTLENALLDLLSFDLLPPPGGREIDSGVRTLRMAVKRQYSRLLPEAIGLVDAFGFSDWELDSALGKDDGRVYEALWDRAQKDPLNESEIPDGYEEYIRPLLLRGQRLAARRGAKL